MTRRYFAGGVAVLLLAVAGLLLFRGSAAPASKLPSPPGAAAQMLAGGDAQLPDAAPSATARTREQKRFDRYDKDRNDGIAREEYLASRRKAFAKLDVNGDGKLAFDEWALKTTTKFAEADKDRSGVLTRAEFATTAPKPGKRAAACVCGSPAAAAPAKDDDES
ncbi:MAG: EF-hand domain-containing protein [Sphingomonas sp.]